MSHQKYTNFMQIWAYSSGWSTNNQRVNVPYMLNWKTYETLYPENTVTGNVVVIQDVVSPQLDNTRDIIVYLPPSYTISDKRYPVMYIHDGQNLFDANTSYAGEWQVDETMESLASDDGIEAIVVGIPNIGNNRMHEYSPIITPYSKGWGDQYLSFIIDTVKPMIDSQFRTMPEREATGIIGSSMGGLISLYGYFRRSDVFGLAGVISPSLWFGGGTIFKILKDAPYSPGKLYLDVGTKESSGKTGLLNRRISRYVYMAREMKVLLQRKGYIDDENLRYVEDNGGRHNEADWARRFPDMMRFLLAKSA